MALLPFKVVFRGSLLRWLLGVVVISGSKVVIKVVGGSDLPPPTIPPFKLGSPVFDLLSSTFYHRLWFE